MHQLIKASPPQQHYDFLDGLRAILALYVVAYHAWHIAGENNGVSRYFGLLAYGHYSVCFFIILSGFCLMLPVLKTDLTLLKGVGNFIQRRAWRILPPYYFALSLSVVLIYVGLYDKTADHWGTGFPLTPRSILTHVFLIQNLVPNELFSINYVFWSIAVEWQIYFFFPLLLLGWRSIGGLYATLATIVLSFLVELGIHHYFDVQPRDWFISLFALGMAAAYASFSASHKTIPWRLVAVVAFLVFVASLHWQREMVSDFIFGLFASSLLVLISHQPTGWLHRLLDFKPLALIGSFSYSLYLIHAPLLQILWRFLFFPLQASPNLMCLALLFIGTPLIVLFAYLFYLLFERPFLQKGRRIVHHQ